MNVFQRLNAARDKFHALKLTKTGHNKFAGYYYFELGDFLIPALKVFSEQGLCAVVSFDADNACMLIRNVEKPDEYITLYSPMGSAALKGCHEVQNIGAVETYQRRYLWVAALEIVEHDALDATTGKETAAKKSLGVKADVLEMSGGVPAERQAWLRELAVRVTEAFDAYGAQAAYETIEQEGLEDMDKIQLAVFLGSKITNQVKAYSIALRKEKATA